MDKPALAIRRLSKQEAQEAGAFARAFVDLPTERNSGQMSLSKDEKKET
jgi:hypothetical protein